MQDAQQAMDQIQRDIKELNPRLSRYNDMQQALQTIAQALNDKNQQIKNLQDGDGS